MMILVYIDGECNTDRSKRKIVRTEDWVKSIFGMITFFFFFLRLHITTNAVVRSICFPLLVFIDFCLPDGGMVLVMGIASFTFVVYFSRGS